MRKLLVVLLALMTSSFCNAEDWIINDTATVSAINEINRIKMNPQDYIFAEATRKDWTEAYEIARAMLQQNLTDWLMETQGADIKGCVARSDEKFIEIKAKRGELYRAFVYLKKTDILPFEEPHKIIGTTIPEKEVKHNVVLKQSSESEQKSVSKASPTLLTPIEREMIKIVKSSDIRSFIKDYEEKAKILSYGKYSNRPSSGLYYMFIYDKDGKVPACLKVNGQKVLNLEGQTIDSLDNYKGCGGIWFKVSE